MTKQTVSGIIDFTKAGRLFPEVACLPSGQSESFAGFLADGLPALWARHFPVAFGDSGEVRIKGFATRADGDGEGVVTVTVTLCMTHRDTVREWPVTMVFPMPGKDGAFTVDGQGLAFPAVLEGPTNDLRECRLLYADHFLLIELGAALGRFTAAMAERLGQNCLGNLTSQDLTGMFPVQACIDSFFRSSPLLQRIDDTNPLARATHLRRVRRLQEPGVPVPDAHRALDATHYGRLDFIETPEGPNIGLVHSLALWSTVDAEGNVLTPYEAFVDGKPSGNTVYLRAGDDSALPKASWDYDGRDGRPYAWVRQDGGFKPIEPGAVAYREVSPVQGLGLSSLLIPFLGSDDANRALMGANMMRQALPVEGREVPWVMSGAEGPMAAWTGAGEDFLADGCLALGANALVAYLPWKGYNFEDAIVVSSAFVERNALTSQGRPLRVGDKLSNRHGSKGVVAAIVPTGDMPRLPDGTPVEVLLNPLGVPSRAVFGAILETAAGLAASRLGNRVVSPPYSGATLDEVRGLLETAGLPATGMLELVDPATGGTYDNPVAVGMQYLFRLNHMAADKLVLGRQRLGSMEIMAMIAQGARSLVEDALGVGPGGGRVAFAGVARLLESAGIVMETGDGPDGPDIRFRVADTPELVGAYPGSVDTVAGFKGLQAGDAVRIDLPMPVPHPWVKGHSLECLPVVGLGEMDAALAQAYAGVIKAAASHRDLSASKAPRVLTDGAAARLREAVHGLLGPTDGSSGLGALVVAASRTIGARQTASFRSVIVPGPEMGITECGVPRDAWITVGLPEDLSDGDRDPRKVLLNRAPTLGPRSLQTLTAVPEESGAIRIHPLLCYALDADFDGDQVAVYGFRSGEGREEGTRLFSPEANLFTSAAGELLAFPTQEMVYGLAYLTSMAEGQEPMAMESEETLLKAYEAGRVGLGTPVLLPGSPQPTTAGRVLFARALPGAHRNDPDITGVEVGKGCLRAFLTRVAKNEGTPGALRIAETLMALGFGYATRSGVSIGLGSLPPALTEAKAALVRDAEAAAAAAWNAGEGHRGVVGVWARCFDGMADLVAGALADAGGPPAELLRIVRSGSRGTPGQLAQLLGMRGMMPVPGECGGYPVPVGFVDGTSAWAHSSSAFGWREGVGNAWTRDGIRQRLGRLLLLGLQDITGPNGAVGIRAAFAVLEPLIMMDTQAHMDVEAILAGAVDGVKEGGFDPAPLVDGLMGVYERSGIRLDRTHAEVAVSGLAGVWRTGTVYEALALDPQPLARLGEAVGQGRIDAKPGVRELLALGYRKA